MTLQRTTTHTDVFLYVTMWHTSVDTRVRHSWSVVCEIDRYICVTWLIQMCYMTHSYVWHDSFIRLKCDMTHSYVWHDSFIRVTGLIHMCDRTHSYVWHDSFVCVTWLIHTCGMTHSYVWRNSFVCVTWLIHMCGMTHSYVWRDSFVCVTWLIHMCGMTHSYVWHDSFTCVAWLIHMGNTHYDGLLHHRATGRQCHTYEWVMSHINVCVCHVCMYVCVTSMNESRVTSTYNVYVCVTHTYTSHVRLALRKNHVCDVTDSYVWRVWHTLRWIVAPSCYWREVAHIESCHTYAWLMTHINLCVCHI